MPEHPLRLRFIAVYQNGFDSPLTELILGPAGQKSGWYHNELLSRFHSGSPPVYAGYLGFDRAYLKVTGGSDTLGVEYDSAKNRKLMQELQMLEPKIRELFPLIQSGALTDARLP